MSEVLPPGAASGPAPGDDVRVGDTERRAVDEWLHRAVGEGQLTLGEYEERASSVWAARTRGELAAVTRDLPGLAVERAAAAPAPARSRPRRAVAVMSGDTLAGPVAPGSPVHAYALMGSAEVDLRRDDLPAEVHVRAVRVMGEIKVLVPEGATVRLSGLGVMGERSVRVAPPRPGASLVHVDATAVMGSVHVRSAGAPHPAVKLLKEARARRSAAVRAAEVPALPVPPMTGSTALEPVRPRRRFRARAGVAALLGAAAVAWAATGEATAVMGSQVVFAQSYEEVDARVLMGSVTIVVPDGVPVDNGGLVVMGSNACDDACKATTPFETPVDVDVLGAMGSARVLTQSEWAAEQADRQADEPDEPDSQDTD